jgi:crossover junction endodeoxyribonuclease RusA
VKSSNGCVSATNIELPFPPATLSGHNNGHWHSKSSIIAKHRKWAAMATIAADATVADGNGDICISVTFYPPDKRGDRVNYPNRLKPYWDGIADALKVNDRRFLPSFHYAEPVKDARVVFAIGGAQ